MTAPEKKANITNEKANEEVKKEKKAADKTEELSSDKLDEVTGGGNPFANIPRVGNKPIDGDLRNNG